jgi:hypothetical protein
MGKSRELSDVNSSMYRKNLLINGGFQVWQRGENGFTGSNNYVSVDRFYATRIRIRKPNTNGNSGEDNRGAVFDCSDGYIYSHVDYFVEGTDLRHGEQYTLSFWAKTPNTSSRLIYIERTGTDYFDSGPSHNITLSSTWQKFTYTGTVVNTGTGKVIVMRWYLNPTPSGQTDVMMQIADVQLELGSVATDFEHRSYGEELALCQRYYQKHYTLGSGVQNSATFALVAVHLPVAMRVVPSVGTKSGGWNNINVEHDDTYDVTSVYLSHGIDGSGEDEQSSFIANVSTSGSNTTGYGVCVMCDRNGDYFTYDAEL